MRTTLMTVVLAAMTAVTTHAQIDVHPEKWPEMKSPVPADPAVEKRIDEIMAKMSVEDKVGQTIQAEIREIKPEEVKKYRIGSVLNGGGGFPNNEKYSTVDDWVALADAFYEASMDTSDGGVDIPIIWGVDAVHGHNNVIGAVLFPHNIGLGAANNPELMRRIGEITAHEVRLTGLDWNFGPTVAVPRDDRWGRTYEGYSEDPEIVHTYAGMMVEGLQGKVGADDWLGPKRAISTAKHFLGDGGTEKGVDQGDNLCTEEDLRDIHAAGYTSALDAGVQVVMASFNSWHGRKMHGYKELLTDVLKDRMGFDGFVVGDWNGHGQVEGCSNKSCAASFNAGVDMFMVPGDWKPLYKNTLKQVEKGEITMERLDDAVRRILRVKIRAGLFEAGRPSSRPLAGREDLVGVEKHRKVARQAVRESLVLLKNNGGVLPINPADSTVLVAGDGADDIGKQAGGWTISWQGTGNVKSDFPGGTSIWDGIKATVEAAGGQAVLSPKGEYETKPTVAIVVFGEDPYAEFQGDREQLDYTGKGLEILKKLEADGIPTVSVFISGRPLWVNPELNASDAFVAAWLPGSEGNGVAEVLFSKADGSVNEDFKGKLSYSWPKAMSQMILNRHDEDYDPLFAYGYGLTYGDEVEVAELSENMDVQSTASSRKTYFAGGPVAPWRMFIGDGNNDGNLLSGGRGATSHIEVRSIDRRVQEDARELKFHGTSAGWAAIQGFGAVDISRESNGALALAVDVRMQEMPTAAVTLRMGCGEDCAGEVDVTDILKGLPIGEWTRVRIRLSCIESAGADMSKIDTPFYLTTTGKMTMGLSDVRLVTEGDGKVVCPE